MPHHLLAADLIARAFLVARDNRYDRIVVLTPDHFKRSRRPFATTRLPFDTVFGRVPTDSAAVDALLGHDTLVEESDLFRREHGIGAVLPYVARFFPGTPIVPIAVAIGSNRDEWDALVAALDPLVSERTLILQSTDFSHYLPLAPAILRDQETLNVIAAGDIDAVAKLHQPQHLDSRGGQYIQMRLQAKHFGAAPVVIANSNMQFYVDTEVDETTSYIVQIYPSAEAADRVDLAGYADGEVLCFAGDTFFGRHLAPVLSQPAIRERLLAEIEAVLDGCPLVLNLEGVTVPEMPTGISALQLAMPEDLTIDVAQAPQRRRRLDRQQPQPRPRRRAAGGDEGARSRPRASRSSTGSRRPTSVRSARSRSATSTTAAIDAPRSSPTRSSRR